MNGFNNLCCKLIEIPLEQIQVNPYQPRLVVDDEKLQELAVSIRAVGLMEPIVVREVFEGYEIVAGERRYRACKILGWSSISAIVYGYCDDDLVAALALVENLVREDLNPFDQTLAILRYLSLALEQSPEEVVEFLKGLRDRIRSYRDRHCDLPADLKQSELKLQRLFDRLPLTWESFVTHRLPILNLPDDLWEVLTHRLLSYSQVKILARVNSREQRQLLVEEVLSENLSCRQLNKRVKEQLEKANPKLTMRTSVDSSRMGSQSQERESIHYQQLVRKLRSFALLGRQLDSSTLQHCNQVLDELVDKLAEEIGFLV